MVGEKFNCILIPGGGLLADGSLPAWTLARLETALELQDQADWIATLSGGTVHKPPPLDGEGFPIFESQKAAEFLIEAGVPPRRILTEISSYDTIGNAYFARLLFSEPMALTNCLIITSLFHMPRSEAIFRWVYSLLPLQHKYSLSFLSTPDVGLSSQALKARWDREKQSLDNLHQQIQKMNTLSAFQEWLYTEHAAYSSNRGTEKLSDDELRSY